jgi:hypothetical protein
MQLMVRLLLEFATFFLSLSARGRMWRDAARDSGLSVVQERRRLGVLMELRGDVDGLGVTLTGFGTRERDCGTRVVVDGRGRIPASISLRSESRYAAPSGEDSGPAGPDCESDQGVESPETALLAALGDESYAAHRSAAWHGEIFDGTVRADAPYGDYAFFSRRLEILLRAAKCLQSPDAVVERLAAVAHDDHRALVRLRSVTFMAHHFPDHTLARGAFRDALLSPDIRVQVGTAVALAPGLTRELVETANIPNPLSDRSLATAFAAKDATVRIFVAEALGRGGAIAAVPALRAAMRSSASGIVFQRVARQAIAAIQARATGASPGQVALAEAESGQISLASDAEAGHVALAAEGRDSP